jgi:hypothetical protein
MATTQTPITILGLETILLQDYAKTAPPVLLRFKAQAVLLAANGVSPEAVASVFARNRSPSNSGSKTGAGVVCPVSSPATRITATRTN